jgi:hypothetical protein
MKFNFDSNEPVKPKKESTFGAAEKAIIIIGIGAGLTILLMKWLAVFSGQLAEALFPSLF